MNVSAHRPTRGRAFQGRHSPTISSERFASVAVPSSDIPAIVRWSFLLFIFTIPFEAASLSFTSSYASLSKLSGFLFFACYLFYYNPLLSHVPSMRSFPLPPPRAMGAFGVYLIIYVLSGVFLPVEVMSSHLSKIFKIFQILVLFWIASSLFRDVNIARKSIFTYALSSSLLALAMILHIPGFAEISVMRGDIERVTALGYDANGLGNNLTLAVVILIGLWLSKAYTYFLSKLSLLILILPLMWGIVQTGSRGAIATVIIGLSIYLLPVWQSHGKVTSKVTSIVLATLGIATVVYMVIHNPSASMRWQQTFIEGRTSGRDRIFSEASGMIWERPIFGWGPYMAQYELGKRVLGSGLRGFHNLYLALFAEVGMVGAIPFLTALWLCGRAAWKARLGSLGLMPLALLLTVLAQNMSVTAFQRKEFWLVLALSTAGASIAAREQGHGQRVLTIRRALRDTT